MKPSTFKVANNNTEKHAVPPEKEKQCIPGASFKVEEEILSADLKEKFQRYLRLIFNDLCSKDNGLSQRTFGLYTF